MARDRFSEWYPGTQGQWHGLSMAERERVAFRATGCLIAYPTWEAPVDCVHGRCQVARQEIHPMVLVNTTLRAERDHGWLRFASREATARCYRAVRAHCRQSGVYEAWSAWALIVGTAVTSEASHA